MPLNGTNITSHVQFVYGVWHYERNLVVAESLPKPPHQGLQGILYDHGESCLESLDPDVQRVQFPDPSVTRIALIRRGNCSFTEKLWHAEQDGASAAIVYDNVSFDQDPAAWSGMVWLKLITGNKAHLPF